MSRVVLVDWLGRGGIAQTSQEWVDALTAHGDVVSVVTRAGRDLVGIGADGRGRIGAHRAVARRAASVIDAERPDVVVVQNYVLPLLERPVFAAARRAGARVVVTVHDHQLHSLLAGNRIGLRRTLQEADAVVAHSAFVGDAVARWSGRPVTRLPLPLHRAVVDAPPAPSPLHDDAGALLALHFGVLKRGYKGTDVVLGLAGTHPEGWRFGLVGAGSPAAPTADNVEVAAGYVENGALAAAVRSTAATLLPYRLATQSGAVALAQALGSVAVATAVGGIVEQIDDGVTGLLLAPSAPIAAWADALAAVRDASFRAIVTANARRKAHDDHAGFVRGVVDVTTR